MSTWLLFTRADAPKFSKLLNWLMDLPRRGTNENAGTLAGTSCSGIVLGDFGTGGGAAFDGVVERGYCFDFALSDTEVALLRAELGF